MDGDGPSNSTLIVEIVFFGMIMLLGIPGNAIVMRLSFRRASHHRSQLLIFSLAVTHICANLFLVIDIFILFSEFLWNSINSCWLIHVANYCKIAVVLLSCSVTSAIAIDRYFTINDLSTYNSRTSLKKLAWYIKILAVVALILAVPAAVVEPIVKSTHCPTSTLSSLYRLYYLIPGLVVIGALLLIMLLSIRIYFIVRKRLAVDKAHKKRLSERYPDIENTQEVRVSVPRLNQVQPSVHRIQPPMLNSSELAVASCEISLPGEVIYDNTQVVQNPAEGQEKEIGDKTPVIPRLVFNGHSDTLSTGVANSPANTGQPLDSLPKRTSVGDKLSTPDVCLAPVLTHVTKMLLLITVTFFLTHVPSVVLLIIWDVKHFSTQDVFTCRLILHHFYIVSYAVNPFLCLYNKTFRRDCRRLLRLSKLRP